MEHLLFRRGCGGCARGLGLRQLANMVVADGLFGSLAR